MAYLEVRGVNVSVDGEQIVKEVNLKVDKGEVVALMGPNASGKSSLSYALMGHPKYKIDKGSAFLDGRDITQMKPDERSRQGLFLSFQNPFEIPGVSISNFLRTALNSHSGKPIDIAEFMNLLREKMAMLKIDEGFSERYINEGFSGGEKKKAEILQMLMLKPKIAILDETDSGLDIDALRIVANGINSIARGGTGVLVITHYKRLLDYIKPSRVYIMMGGRIVREGGPELINHLEKEGYEWLNKD
ncbi:Fe-S cluster assembly ATPase SufC [Candidatus Woesearchaeota archaeon]|nr:Fe-S cluster assembly ATPase SufC [Candidatus Woesearchaeota archaeon]